MPDRVLGFLRGTPAPDRIPDYHDPVLGQLALAPENPEWWEANLTLGGRPVRIGVGGGREPDPTLLARAQEIVRDFESLERRLAAFLAREAREHSYLRAWSEEIAALCIEGVHLFWPERPTEGVIFFEGPSADRGWRSGFTGDKFWGLAFDS
jgi:hypothetical protein